jgi:hypothetical protein
MSAPVPVNTPDREPVVSVAPPAPALAAVTVKALLFEHCTVVALPVEETALAVAGSIVRVKSFAVIALHGSVNLTV